MQWEGSIDGSSVTSIPPYFKDGSVGRTTETYEGVEPGFDDDETTGMSLVRIVLKDIIAPGGKGLYRVEYKGLDGVDCGVSRMAAPGGVIRIQKAVNVGVKEGWEEAVSGLGVTVIDEKGRSVGSAFIGTDEVGDKGVRLNSAGWRLIYSVCIESLWGFPCGSPSPPRPPPPPPADSRFSVPALRNSMFSSTTTWSGPTNPSTSLSIENWFYGPKAPNGMPTGCQPPPDPAPPLTAAFAGVTAGPITIPTFLVKSITITRPEDTQSTYILVESRTGHSILVTTADDVTAVEKFAEFAACHIKAVVNYAIHGGSTANDMFTELVKIGSSCTYYEDPI